MPPDKFDALAAAVRKLRDETNARGLATRSSYKKVVGIEADVGAFGDGLLKENRDVLQALDTLMAEHGIER